MPNNPRTLLWGALLILLLLNYEAWMRDYGPQSAAQTAVATHNAPPPPDLVNQVPHASTGNGNAVAPPQEAGQQGATPPAPGAAAAPMGAAPVVHVRTDVLDVDISTRGGTIERAALLRYPLVKGQQTPVTLENPHDATRYLLLSGLTGPGEGSFPDHLAEFTAASKSFELGSQQTELRVPLTWHNDQGLSFTKTFVFRRGQYRIGLEQELTNSGSEPVQVAPYTQILRNDPRTKASMFDVESRSYHGPVFYDGNRYRKLDMSPDGADAHLSKDVQGGWIAASQHHFVTAVVPPTDQPMRVTMRVQGDQYLLAATGPTRVVAPNTTAHFPVNLFIGPMLQNELDAVGPRLRLVTDYGNYLSILAKPLFSLLSWVHRMTGNWGIAIIVVTFLLKAIFYPLQESAGRSMAKMKNLGPRIKNLQETYKDDREKLGVATMELYRREKVNPVAGCVPMLIQIPVFIAFYWVLIQSVEIRQAPFMLWIRDLSAHDPYFVLPGIMALAMFLQYKMNPTSPDPVQAKAFMVMPFVMSFMFAFFPAGLVLYQVTNTLLSIAQQWNINRRLEAAGHKAKA